MKKYVVETFLILLFLAHSQVAANPDAPIIKHPACQQVELAVCGEVNNYSAWYANRCSAEKFNASTVSISRCWINPRFSTLFEVSDHNCPTDLNPVCTISARGVKRSYSSICKAQKFGAKIIHEGSCRQNQEKRASENLVLEPHIDVTSKTVPVCDHLKVASRISSVNTKAAVISKELQAIVIKHCGEV